MLRSLIDFGRLNLPIIAKFHKKICGKIPCGSMAKIEAGQIHKLWRSLELRICNFLKNHLTTSAICRSERTAFVVFLEKSKVRIPLRLTKLYEMTKSVNTQNKFGSFQKTFFATTRITEPCFTKSGISFAKVFKSH